MFKNTAKKIKAYLTRRKEDRENSIREASMKKLLEAACTSYIETHLITGKTFLRISQLSFNLSFSYEEIKECLLEDPRTYPKADQPDILTLHPFGVGVEG